MKISIKDAAKLVDGKIIGDANLFFSNIARIDQAHKGELSFLYLSSYEKYLNTTNASIVIVNPNIETHRKDLTYIVVDDPNNAFHKIVSKYFMPKVNLKGIDKSAFVDATAIVGQNVAIGKNVVISKNCIIGDNTKIFHNSVIMENVKIGNNTLIYPNVTIREKCKIGNFVILHPGVVIGSDGFGFSPDEKGIYHKIPQIGNVVIKNDVEIGANVTIDRAAIGSTVINKGVKLDNLIQIAHNVEVGEHTVISAQSGVSGSTKIGKHCILAGQVGTVGHIEITDNVIIGAQSGVSKAIKKPGKYFGYPAKEWSTSLRLEAHIRSLPKYAGRINELEKEIENLKKQLNSDSIKEE